MNSSNHAPTQNGNTKTVAVIIPTLDESEYIGSCLHSLSCHAGECVSEIIVVDAGSADNTVELARSSGATVLTTPKGTIADQRNIGANACTSDLIAFLDADCTIEPGWAENAAKHFTDASVVSAGAPPEIPQLDASWVQETWCFLKRKRRQEQHDVSWIASANLWVRRSSFEEIGGFDPTLETCEDADLGFRLCNLGRIVSDSSIRVQHHREPKTLIAFYKKEVWHGKHSFDGVANGRFTAAEFPSLITPLLFCVSAFVAIGAIAFGSPLMTAIGLAGVAVTPIAYTIRAMIQKGHWLRFGHCLVIYFFYFAARSEAFVRWIARRLISIPSAW